DLNGGGLRDGWLNRLLQQSPGLEADVAYAIGRDQMLVLSGDAPAARWSPDARLNLSPHVRRLLEVVYHGDPLFQRASSDAIAIAEALASDAGIQAAAETEGMMDASPMMEGIGLSGDHVKLAEFAAGRLRGDTRIASFSISGWDTHDNQSSNIARALSRLSDTILTLRTGLGAAWGQTAVLCMTEFGRSARENGSRGTDHGTGGAMLFAGGAMRGGRVISDWPGLGEGDLYAGRDLLPTRDIRAYAAWVMRAATGVSVSALEGAIFPDLEMGADPRLLL
ncbi:MAG: DUF1501 domain-containing protein, partial [Octadecabacter sp.]